MADLTPMADLDDWEALTVDYVNVGFVDALPSDRSLGIPADIVALSSCRAAANDSMGLCIGVRQRVILLVLCPLVALGEHRIHASDPPCELHCLDMRRSQTVDTHILSMRLANSSERGVYFLVPRRGYERIPERIIYRHADDDEAPLRKFFADSEDGAAVIGIHAPSSQSQLSIIPIPAHSILKLPRFSVDDYFDIDHPRDILDRIEIVEAQNVLVNGKVPLEEWLPFRIGVYKRSELSDDEAKWLSESRTRHAYGDAVSKPGEQVEFIEARGMRRWTVKIAPIPKLPIGEGNISIIDQDEKNGGRRDRKGRGKGDKFNY